MVKRIEKFFLKKEFSTFEIMGVIMLGISVDCGHWLIGLAAMAATCLVTNMVEI